MKKSEIYHRLQLMVIKNHLLCFDNADDALEAVKELAIQEGIRKYEEEKAGEQE